MPVDLSNVGDRGLVLFYQDKYYVIPESVWQDPNNIVSGDDIGRAKVLVDRGALLADIPDDAPPVGVYCILLNVAKVSPPTTE